jgi:4-aminobutyrate aminotransferase
MAGLRKLQDSQPQLSGARGLGLMLAIDVVDASGKPDPQRRHAIIHSAFARGLLLLGCGKSAIRFCPPMCVTAEEVETALEIFASSV